MLWDRPGSPVGEQKRVRTMASLFLPSSALLGRFHRRQRGTARAPTRLAAVADIDAPTAAFRRRQPRGRRLPSGPRSRLVGDAPDV